MWNLFTRDQNVSPPMEGSNEYESREKALRAACQSMKQVRVTVLYIEGPNGEGSTCPRSQSGAPVNP